MVFSIRNEEDWTQRRTRSLFQVIRLVARQLNEACERDDLGLNIETPILFKEGPLK